MTAIHSFLHCSLYTTGISQLNINREVNATLSVIISTEISLFFQHNTPNALMRLSLLEPS